MAYTLGQAAKATGKSKPTIARAIQSGKMSAQRQEDGAYLIDPAELHRVFPPVTCDSNETGDMKQLETLADAGTLQALLDVLHVERERERNELKATIDDLRERLDRSEVAREAAAVETRRLTLMLTDQRQPQPEASPPKPATPGVRLPFWFALVAVSAAAASWYLWPWVAGDH